MDFFFLNKTRKVLAWQKNSAIARFTFKRHTNNKIKIYNKTHMNIKEHKAKYIQMSGHQGRGGEGRGSN